MLASSTLASMASAMPADRAPAVVTVMADGETPYGTTQSNCASLQEAVERIRRQGNVKQVLSAETRTRGGREVHYVKVLTTDGKVRTHTVNGCRR